MAIPSTAPIYKGRLPPEISVNRELSLLRAMLNVAKREGWIRKHPMLSGDSMISVGCERERQRIITLKEEARLLAACTGRREHLRPLVVAALETGMHKDELLKLRWRDIDLAQSMFAMVAFNTKP